MTKRDYKLANIVTRGVGLDLKQRFEALKKDGADKVFKNKCFISKTEKGVWLLSKDFKFEIFAPKERVLSVEILAQNLVQMYANAQNEPLQEKAV